MSGRKIALLVAAALAFGAAPYVGQLGSVVGSLLLLGLAMALGFAASGGFFVLAAAGGAGGAFASSVLSAVSPAAAGAALVGLAYAERTTRVRGRSSQLMHISSALIGGALAGTLSAAYAQQGPTEAVRVVAMVVAAVLVALPLFVDADDPVAHALGTAADLVGNPAQTTLNEGAELRRRIIEVPLDPRTAKSVRGTWRALVRLAEARVRLQRSRSATVVLGSPTDAVEKMVDRKLADHVAALARAYTAFDAAHAAEIGLDDTALKSAENAGESLEDVSRAMADVKL